MSETVNPSALRIGELARLTGVSSDTIRHYERLGLIGKAPRTNAGYRLFPAQAVDRIRLIQGAVRVGFSLRQLSTFLGVRRAGGPPCHDVRDAASRILQATDKRLAELTEARASLQKMLEDWDNRLERTPPRQPAHLLDTLSVGTGGVRRSPVSNLKRPR